MLAIMWSKGNNTLPLLVKVQTCKTTFEVNSMVSQKTWNSSTLRPSYTTPGHIPKRCSTISHRQLLSNVHSSVIHNRQKWERTWMFLNWRMDKRKCGTSIQWNTIQLFKNKDIMNFAGKWMELENILSEVTKTQKDMHGMYSISGY